MSFWDDLWDRTTGRTGGGYTNRGGSYRDLASGNHPWETPGGSRRSGGSRGQKGKTGTTSQKSSGGKKKAGGSSYGGSSALYDAYADAMNRQSEILRQQQELAYRRRKARYEAAVNANNQASRDSLRQRYIAAMMSRKNLPQRLRGMGISGGAAETSLVDVDNTYQNNRNSIIARRDRANARARRAFDRGVGDDFSAYLTKEFRLQKDIASRYLDALPDNIKAEGNLAVYNPEDLSRYREYNSSRGRKEKEKSYRRDVYRIYRALGYTDRQIRQMMAGIPEE